MKICFVAFGLSGWGGVETVMLATRREFLRRGHSCEIILLGGSQDREWLRGIPAIELGSPGTMRIVRYLLYAVRFPLILRSLDPDVVLAINPPGVWLLSKIRRLLRLHMDIVFWPHWPFDPTEAKSLPLADYHFSISTGFARLLTRILGDAKRIHTVFNAIELDVPELARSTTPVFLNVGRLQIQQQKRTDDLLRAAAMLKGHFEIRIAGAGKDGEALRQMATDLGIAGRVQWLGWQKDPWAVVGEASAVVLCSSWEGFPMVLGEALARGVPCISSDCPSGPEDMIEEGRNGWLVPVGDIPKLAAAMQNVIDHLEALPSPSAVIATAQRFGPLPVVDSMMAAIESERLR